MNQACKHKLTRGGYQTGLSLLRVVATVCVIWLHTCSTLAENADLFHLGESQLRFFSAAYQMMYWAVPCFFMITGALLLNPEKTITANDCVWKYGRRIALVLFLFGIPFAMLKIVMETGNVNVSILPLAVKAVLEKQSLSHLWYLYELIGIYLILPMLRWFVAKADNNEVKMLIVALVIMDFVIPLINAAIEWDIGFDIPLKYPVLYVLLGWLLNKSDLKKYTSLCFAVAVLAVISIWVLNYVIDDTTAWTSYNSPLILILSISLFAIFKNLEIQKKEMLWKIDRLCFAVYLVHPVLIQFTYRFLKITPARETQMYLLATIGYFAVFVIGSFVGSWILNMIKPLRRYVL